VTVLDLKKKNYYKIEYDELVKAEALCVDRDQNWWK